MRFRKASLKGKNTSIQHGCNYFYVYYFCNIFIAAYRNKKKTSLLLAQQKTLIEEQKMVVEEKQKALLDSIHYAKSIQQAILPTEAYIERILYKTKNNK